MDRNKLTIILVWFIDVLWISIYLPTLPDLAVYYNVSAHTLSYAISAYALFSFIFWPILGQLSDIYWRKKILLLCIIWAFIANLVMTLSPIFLVFLIWRIIAWISWGNISIIQAMLWDISKDKKERMSNMWIIWWLFWLCFIIWPLIWSLLITMWWVKAPFWFLTAFSFIEILMIIFFLKETNYHTVEKKLKFNPFWNILNFFKHKEIWLFLISFFLLTLSFSMYQWMMPMYLSKHFGIPWNISWFILSWVWVMIVLNQLFLLKRFWLKYFTLKKLFIILNTWLFISFVILSFPLNFAIFLVFFAIIMLFQWPVMPVYQSEVVDFIDKWQRWEIMWVMASLQSMSMFFWPMLSWILIDKNISMFIVAAFIVFINLFITKAIIWKIQH